MAHIKVACILLNDWNFKILKEAWYILYKKKYAFFTMESFMNKSGVKLYPFFNK